MENEDMYQTALQIARAAHYNQFDKAGVPYIQHVLAVSRLCKDPKAKIAGLLHDVLEDTDVLPNTIFDLFGETVYRALIAITKMGHEPYDAYITRVGMNPIARNVKIADLEHNMDLSRLDHEPTDKDIQRVERYRHSRDRLLNLHD